MLNLEDLFDESFYFAVYPEAQADVKSKKFPDGLSHFRKVGAALGYSPSDFFDSGFYVDTYDDVAQEVESGKTTPIDHFLKHGQFEGRDPIVEFYTDEYLVSNSDVNGQIQATRDTNDPLTAYGHYLENGQFESRYIGPDFVDSYYLAKNPDVKQEVEKRGRSYSGIQHYLEYGYFEGREGAPPDPNEDFSLAESAGSLDGELVLTSEFSEFDNTELFSFVVEQPTGLDIAFEANPGEVIVTRLLSDLGDDGELDYDDILSESEPNGALQVDYLEPGVYYIEVESLGSGAVPLSAKTPRAEEEDSEDSGTTVRVTPKPAIAPPEKFPQPAGFNFYWGRGLVNVQGAVEAGAAPALTVADGDNFEDLNLINTNAAWSQEITGKGMVVAVLDDGVDLSHPEFEGRIWTNPKEQANGMDDDGNGLIDDIRGWDYVGNDNDPNPPEPSEDHGTHVAGSIGAARNGTGTTGVAYDARIMALRVLGTGGGNADTQIAPAIRYAVDNGANVINMSLGSDPDQNGQPAEPTGSVAQALSYAREKGVLVAIASGNERDDQKAVQPGEPAFQGANGLAVTVGAIDRDRKIGDFSNPVGGSGRAYNFVVAPGVAVKSTAPGRGYKDMQGTSMATPHTAGVLALMRQKYPTKSVAEIEALLVNTADPNNITV